MKRPIYSWDDCWLEINRLRRDLHRVFDRMRQLSPGRSGMAVNVAVVADLAMQFAAEVCGENIGDLKAHCRKNSVAWARHIAICLTKEFTGATLREVQEAFGHFDHNTIRYACKKVRGETVGKYVAQVEAVRGMLRSALSARQLAPTSGARPCPSKLKRILEEK